MSRSRTLLLSLAALLFYVLCVVVVREQFTARIPGANDFYPRWKGAHLFFDEGINPYSQEATAAIQMDMYGRLAEPHEDQVAFAYPFYTVFFIYPLVALNLSYSWAQATWMVLLLFALVLATILILRLLSWRVPVLLLAAVLLWGLLSYNSVRTIVLGQFAGFVFLAMVGCLWALKSGKHNLAGFLLVVATIKPQMSVFFIAALLLWAFWQNQWQLIKAFSLGLGFFFVLSTVLMPSWFIDFFNHVVNYTTYTATGSPVWIVTNRYFAPLALLETPIIILLLLYMVYKWRLFQRVTIADEEFLALITITLLITNLVVVRTATTNQIVLYLPILWLLKTVADNSRVGNGLLLVFMSSSLVLGWVLFIETSAVEGEQLVMYLWLPALTLLLLGANEVQKARVQAASAMQDDASQA